MALLGKNLSDRERAALYMHVFGGVNDWRLLYRVAVDDKDPGPFESLSDFASKWKRTQKVQSFIEDLRTAKIRTIDKARTDGIEEGKRAAFDSVHTNTDDVPKRGTFVDYSDPKAQTRKLNELVNRADDPGEALDALKVIISTQKAGEAAKERKTVQYYRPIRCNQCPLYQSKAQKGKK